MKARPAAVALVVLAAITADAGAQRYRISQRATLAQTLGSTRIEIDYSRPLVRGRDSLFGKVVHWGELWTPGANEATVLQTSDTITLNGTRVPPGRWSMWIIPSRVGPWELVLDSRDSLFHTMRPELTDEQIRMEVAVREDAPPVEALIWTFPRIAQDGATLRMNWASVEIDLAVGVKSNVPTVAVSPDEARRYVGEWRVTFNENPATGRAPPPATVTIAHTDSGALRITFPPGIFTPPPRDTPEPDTTTMTPQERERAEAKRKLAEFDEGEFSYVLVPRAEGVFMMGWMDDGMLYDVEEFYHEFEFDGARATRMTFRTDKDQVMATAERAKKK